MKKEEMAETKAPSLPVEVFPDCAAARLARGIALKDLSNETRIRLSYLEAIEKGDFEKLPEPIYAQTFIKTYAEAVGVDAAVLLAYYRTYLEKCQVVRPLLVEKKQRVMLGLDHQTSYLKTVLKKLGWIVPIVVAIGFLASFFATHMNNQLQREWISPLPATPTAPAIPPATPSPAASTAVSTAASSATTLAPLPAQQAVPTSYKLVIEATDTTWISLVEDDNPPFEVLLRSGERVEREASKKFALDIGNAGGVILTFQGKSMGRLGQKGQVVHLTLPEDGH